MSVSLRSSSDLSRTPSPLVNSNYSRPSTPSTPAASKDNLFKSSSTESSISNTINLNSYRFKDGGFTAPPVATKQDEYLNFIEPAPVSPPEYDTLPPGGCPKYPLLSEHPMHSSKSDKLPGYSPAVYKITLVGRKQEWISPYEPLTSRLWKNVIMELNLTQLNFYLIPALLETKTLQAFHKIRISSSCTSMEKINDLRRNTSFVLSFTGESDIKFNEFCISEGLLGNKPVDAATVKYYVEQNNFPSFGGGSYNSNSYYNSNNDSKSANAGAKNLIRSYTLQHSRVGLATDYKKRANVLRIRAESEQILIDIGDVQDLIDWNMALGVGKDVSLDVLERELPMYRTVPRRRRARRRNTTSDGRVLESEANGSTSGSTTKNRARLQLDLTIRGRLGRIRLKLLLSSSFSNSNSNSNLNISNSVNNIPSSSASSVYGSNEYDISSRSPPKQLLSRRNDSIPDVNTSIPVQPIFRAAIFNLGEGGNSTDDDRSVNNDSPAFDNDLGLGDGLVDDDNYTGEIDDEDDADVDEYDPDIVEMDRWGKKNSFNDSDDDFKWDPLADTQITIQKYFRSCLRCIKPLTAEDLWVGKVIVKPTTISPLSFSYLRNYKYGDFENSHTSLASLSLASGSASSSSRKHTGGLDLPHMDSALPRVPNHFVKEYTVGSHGLIPRCI